jgi:uncharacterized protein YndB with AHSA1/START domain
MTASASSRATAPTASAEPELVITRTFDAPRPLVFEAWTDARHLSHWQGAPMGFTVTIHESDIRPGGSYHIVMRSPEGVDHGLQGVYKEVVAPERLVFTHTWLRADGTPGKETLVTITLRAIGEKTELTLRQTGFDSVASRDGHNGGWNSTFDRLAAYLSDTDSEATHQSTRA